MEAPFAMYDALTSIDVPPEKVRVVVQSMEHDMALLATRTQFDQLDQFSAGRFELLRAETAATRERIETMNGRFEQMDKRFEQMDKRFEQMERRFELIDQRFVDLEAKLVGEMDRRFGLLDRRIGGVTAEFKQELGKLRADLVNAKKDIAQDLLLKLGAMMGGMLLVFGSIMSITLN